MENKFFKELQFDEKKISYLIGKVNPNLKNYIINNILDEYELNDEGHNINHINSVLKRSFELANDDIDVNILYICATFHDIACHIDRKKHEILSAKRAYEDKFLNEFFSEDQMQTIKEAIEDHRASLEYVPRNINGKILSSADRKVEVKSYLQSSLSYGFKNYPNLTKMEAILRTYDLAIEKFGKNGYAVYKFYVDDKKYEQFLNDLQYLIDNKDEYIKLAEIVYKEIKGE